MTLTATPRTYAEYSQPLWRRVAVTRETAVIALLVAVVLYATLNVPNFDGPLTLTYLLLDVTPILLIALPMTMVIVTGEIDLSVASVVGLSSVLVGVLHEGGFSIPAAAAVALVAGAACGCCDIYHAQDIARPARRLHPVQGGARQGRLSPHTGHAGGDAGASLITTGSTQSPARSR